MEPDQCYSRHSLPCPINRYAPRLFYIPNERDCFIPLLLDLAVRPHAWCSTPWLPTLLTLYLAVVGPAITCGNL